jgi:hypothetical protein
MTQQYLGRFALFVLFTLAPIARSDPASPSTLDTLQTKLNAVHLERMRWERLMAVQADLAQHPDKLSASVTAASDELQGEGRSLTVEGFSMGLSGVCQYGAKILEKTDWRTAKKLVTAGTRIDFAYKVFVEDQVRGKGQPENANAGIEQAAAALKLAADGAPDKATREQVGALIDIGTPGVELLSKLMNGDNITSEEEKALMKDTLMGTRAMMLAYIQHRKPEDWIGIGKAVAKAYPRIGEFAGLAASRGVLVANLLNSAASICVGGYAWHEGVLLEGLADDLRANQQHAAIMLQALLPHARQARASALLREARLEKMIQALKSKNLPPPNLLVPPSRRVLDDGMGVPPSIYAGLQTTLATLQSSPPMTYQLTKNELRRREEIARAEREAEKERERAAQQAEERREREQEEREQNASNNQSYRGQNEPRQGRVDLSGVQGRIQKVVNNVLPNW